MQVLINTIDKVKEFCNLAQKFSYEITVGEGKYIVDGKSLMGLFSIDVSKPVKVTFHEQEKEIAERVFERFSV